MYDVIKKYLAGDIRVSHCFGNVDIDLVECSSFEELESFVRSKSPLQIFPCDDAFNLRIGFFSPDASCYWYLGREAFLEARRPALEHSKGRMMLARHLSSQELGDECHLVLVDRGKVPSRYHGAFDFVTYCSFGSRLLQSGEGCWQFVDDPTQILLDVCVQTHEIPLLPDHLDLDEGIELFTEKFGDVPNQINIFEVGTEVAILMGDVL